MRGRLAREAASSGIADSLSNPKGIIGIVAADSRTPQPRMSATVKAALIGALASVVLGLGAVAINSYSTNNAQESAQEAALKQQRENFRQERALTDRNDLRKSFEAAAFALEDATTELDKMHHAWRTIGRAVRIPRELRVAGFATSRAQVRLSLRIGPRDPVWKDYKIGTVFLNGAMHQMENEPPTQRVRAELDRARAALLRAMDSFLNRARKQLRSPVAGSRDARR